MKKIIALGTALFVFLFAFTATKETAVVEDEGIQVCSDLPPVGNPFD